MFVPPEIQSSPEEAQYVIDLAKSKALGTSLGGAITFRTALDMFEVSLENKLFWNTPQNDNCLFTHSLTFPFLLYQKNPNDKIPLGLARLDKALGGGITMGQVTEICKYVLETKTESNPFQSNPRD